MQKDIDIVIEEDRAKNRNFYQPRDLQLWEHAWFVEELVIRFLDEFL